jgi:hypothetical protein
LDTATGVTAIIGAAMAKKKDRAFFICPRWNEVEGKTKTIPVHERTLAAIKAGRPVARSTLRKALLAARQALGATAPAGVRKFGSDAVQAAAEVAVEAAASSGRYYRSAIFGQHATQM